MGYEVMDDGTEVRVNASTRRSEARRERRQTRRIVASYNGAPVWGRFEEVD